MPSMCPQPGGEFDSWLAVIVGCGQTPLEQSEGEIVSLAGVLSEVPQDGCSGRPPAHVLQEEDKEGHAGRGNSIGKGSEAGESSDFEGLGGWRRGWWGGL